MSAVLWGEYPFTVFPSVAEEIGLKEAIMLQEIQHRTQAGLGRPIRLGKYWINDDPQEWKNIFKFFSLEEIRETLISLRDQGFILEGYEKGDPNPWYTVNHENETIRKFKGY
jgi:hypothetical protein